MSDVNKILDEQIRVLKTGGYYVIVTLAQDHIVTRLRERFRTGFSANVHWIPTRSPLSTFLFAFRKLENTKATTTYKIYFASDAQTSASNHVIRSLLSSNKHVLTVDNPTSYITNLQHATYSYRILGEHGEGVRFDTSLTPVSPDHDDEKKERSSVPKYELSVIDRKSGGRVLVVVVRYAHPFHIYVSQETSTLKFRYFSYRPHDFEIGTLQIQRDK